MPKTKQQKREMVSEITSLIDQSRCIVFSTFSGVSIKDIEQLRKSLRDSDSSYKVFKKTIIKKVFKDKGIECGEIEDWFGNVGAAASVNDEIAPAKILYASSKNFPALKIEAGMLEGRYIDEEQVKQLALLPRRDELVASVVRTIHSPRGAFVNVLSGNQRALVNVLSQIRDNK
jgi:large subunit ribosomal protein L10